MEKTSCVIEYVTENILLCCTLSNWLYLWNKFVSWVWLLYFICFSDWKSAVESMLDNDPTWLICGNDNTLPLHTTLPALIIQHPYSHVYPKKCNVCKYKINEACSILMSAANHSCSYLPLANFCWPDFEKLDVPNLLSYFSLHLSQ